MKIFTVVSLFQTISYRSACKSNFVYIFTNFVICFNHAYWHLERKRYFICIFPFSLKIKISVFFFLRNSLWNVDFNSFFTSPFWDSKRKSIRKIILAGNFHGNISIPGHITRKRAYNLLFINHTFNFATNIQMCEKRIIVLSICVICNGSYNSCNIWRTTGTTKPFLTD